MSLFVVAREAWRADPGGVAEVLAATLDPNQVKLVLLDAQALTRWARACPGLPGPAPETRDMGTWLRRSPQFYRPDESAIAADLQALGPTETLVLDASAYDLAILAEVLRHMRRVLFSAATWPAAIAVILREEVLEEAMGLLPEAFYLMPTRRTHKEASVFAHKLHRAASYARLFGWSQGGTSRFFVATSQRLVDTVRRIRRQDETDFIK